MRDFGESSVSAMKCKSICFCIPGHKKKEILSEEGLEKSSISHRKSGKRGKSKGNVTTAPGDEGHSEPSQHGAGNTSNDAGAAVLMTSAVHGLTSAMEGSGCGSSHGGGGGGGGDGG